VRLLTTLALAVPLEAGYRQEIADVNAAGGVAVGGSRERLKLVVMDNGSDPGTARNFTSRS
jgi:branched-chain amino acid transport system substrate-binding protein